MTRNDRWVVALGVALLCGGAGFVLGDAALLAGGVVAVTYAVYGAATGPPGGPVEVRRSVSDREPTPGSRVRVTVEVENVGDAPVPEVRVIDDPPGSLKVIEGSLAHATSLAAGEVASFSYVLRARRGRHAFGDVRVVARNVSGSVERSRRVEETVTLSSRTSVDDLPLADQTTPYDGRVETDAPGEGVAFHSVRAFHPADPLSRIDWKRYARTRELTTVRFRETRAATVVVVVDARKEARVARRAGDPDGKSLSAYAGGNLASVLLASSNRVGAALFGRQSYLPPGTGRDQAMEVAGFFEDAVDRTEFDPDEGSSILDAAETTFGRHARADGGGPTESSSLPHGTRREFDRLRRRLPDDAQVVLCSPLLDDRIAAVTRLLAAHDHAVTVVSPDVTTDETHGGAFERVSRARRLRSLRPEIRVVDWSPDDPLAVAVDRARRRWSR